MSDCAALIKEIQSLPPSSWGKVLDFVEHLKQTNTEMADISPQKKLSERLAGALKVSPERYEEMQAELRAGRIAWNNRHIS